MGRMNQEPRNPGTQEPRKPGLVGTDRRAVRAALKRFTTEHTEPAELNSNLETASNFNSAFSASSAVNPIRIYQELRKRSRAGGDRIYSNICFGDAEIEVEHRIQFSQLAGEDFPVGDQLGMRGRIEWFGQCRLAPFRERSCARAAVGAAGKPIQFNGAPLHLANCLQRHRLRDFSARELLQLPAREPAAAHWPLRIDRAQAIAISRARLGKPRARPL